MQISQILKTQDTYNQKDPIANSQLDKSFNPIGNRREQTSIIVDRLLDDYSELIDQRYAKWFAKHFYRLPFNAIHRAASEARHDGKDPKRLFAHLIRKYSASQP